MNNSQIIYFHPQNAKGFAMNLMRFGISLFIKTNRVSKLDEFKHMYINSNKNLPPDLSLLSEFIFDNLIDTIKITICFENYMKALCILNGYVIHKLDKNIFPNLYKEQYKRPIKLEEILNLSEFEVNKKIKENSKPKYQIKGLLEITVGIKELLNTNYQDILNISPNFINLCKPYFDYRNRLHLFNSEEFYILPEEYKNMIEIINFVNENMIHLHNELIDFFSKGEKYKIMKIKI